MEDLRIRRGVTIPGAELRMSASRSSGPGGQNVNKSNTRVTLRWNVESSGALSERQRALLRVRLGGRITHAGDLVVHARSARSRARNLELARERLAALAAQALESPRARVATEPGAAASERRLRRKQRRAALKRNRRRPGVDD
ncbi:MAG TPA: alternative ribosome rescue aminoacyl-tRNA hydrolase ArfB [Myxococcota bacterium]|nr:alternative ribosome rescue aminoacyl-tRNA hydrolase ArfB [Myxococcota bacterium]